MKVFVAGGTGVIGRSLIPRLVAAGHTVTAITRSRDRLSWLREHGAEGEVCDVFDVDRLQTLVEHTQPEVVVHQLTALPDRTNFRKRKTFEATTRLRRDGTRILLEAAEVAGARRFVCQSIAFVYDWTGGPVKTESDALLTTFPGAFDEGIQAVREMESMVLSATDTEGIILRYGLFYGPGTTYAPGHAAFEDAQRRRLPIVGDGSGVFSFIHVDDAATATIQALDHGARGIYNVADDEPAAMREWLPVYAKAIGAPAPPTVPKWLARVIAGPGAAEVATQMRGAANTKAKRELAWSPTYATWRRGFRSAAGNS